MPASYNLRSLERKKGISVGHCYLQDFLENKSPEIFNAKVRLERMKLLESHDIHSSRFYLENGRITIKQNKSVFLNRNCLLKIFCTVILLLLVASLYWKDYLQSYDISVARKYAEIHPAIKQYYFNAFKFNQKILKKRNFKQKDSNNEEEKSISDTLEEKFIQIYDDLEIRKLVRNYFDQVKKRNKIENARKPSKSFIEDQCKNNLKDKFSSLKNNFYNLTVPELTNITDYALESQGAKIVSVFNTEPYGIITWKFLHLNLCPEIAQFLMNNLKWFTSTGPNSVLMPWKKPGDCWAFKGSHGRIQIELSQKIVITAISIDHIPKEVAPNGNIQSAPKEFSVIGIRKCKNEICKTYLGSYEYQTAGPATQTFYVYPKVHFPVEGVEIDIQSNHGNDKYTCIYKIRVHGY